MAKPERSKSSKETLDKVIRSLRPMEIEIYEAEDLDELEQETLEVALDDAVVRLIKNKVVVRQFSKDRTFAQAFSQIFGEQVEITKLAKELEISTSEYTDEFSPSIARDVFGKLMVALRNELNASTK